MRKATYIFTLVFLGASAFLFSYYWGAIKGILLISSSPTGDIASHITEGDSPIVVPTGFSFDVFAKVPAARVIVFDDEGDMWVSQTKLGQVTYIKINNGEIVSQDVILSGLRKPHGLVFDPENSSVLYIAEENALSRVNLRTEEKILEKVLDFPPTGGHSTRTLGFGPDFSDSSGQASRLYISIGSSCNVCNETHEWRATILSMGKSASDVDIFARGLRNAVFFIWHPLTRDMWVTEMGRDFLGDDLPPDEINIVEKGKFYGWPVCYGDNVHDIDFDKNTYIRNPCQEPFEIPSYVDIPAHSAPLGLAFIEPRYGWPRDYWNDLIVAYHGSWNRTTPTGYKLVRVKLDADGNKEQGGPLIEDFAVGWLKEKGGEYEVLGRPADVVFGPDNALYVSDDSAGFVYRIAY